SISAQILQDGEIYVCELAACGEIGRVSLDQPFTDYSRLFQQGGGRCEIPTGGLATAFVLIQRRHIEADSRIVRHGMAELIEQAAGRFKTLPGTSQIAGGLLKSGKPKIAYG